MPLPWTDAADALESASLDTIAGMDLEIKRLLRTRHMLAAALSADGVEVPPFDQPGIRPSILPHPETTEMMVKKVNTLAAKIARLLDAEGPKRVSEIAHALETTDARVSAVIASNVWFTKTFGEHKAPWKVSNRGLESRALWELPAEPVGEAS